ncbi:hypothetical protein [Acinetobacter pittii]|uniref:hypothetical protein n=1 Tax=Acinetobacter pittii TaxID=48296 RepID=UPI000838463D|nr:hypothetical protein [Acinetobacter pittii]OCY22077.1 hypothetical protein BFR62_10050 [Acinetobacter pittii]
MIRITNFRFHNFKTAICATEYCELIVENAYFENVQTCYEVKKVRKKTDKQNKKLTSNNELNLDIKEVIQNLHNLEIQSKMNKDFEQLKKIKKLKGLIGSKEFICEYLALREKG